ncbi:MAG TPA: ATP-binding protein [Candidatus Acidoferrales bacterium]
MQSLYLKIFLWFWLAMILVSGTLIFSVMTTRDQFNSNRNEQFDKTLTSLVAARAADLLQDHGMGALADYLGSLQQTLHWQAYLFDDEGKEILSQPAPVEAEGLAQSALQTNDPKYLVSHGNQFVAKRTTDSVGNRYVFVSETKIPSVASVLQAPLGVQIIRGLAVVLIGGFGCFWLARSITKPVRELSIATHRLADGGLDARVGDSVTGKQDEVAQLGRDFNHMAEQIESLMASQRRLITDISHELRSPLARLSVALGIARRSADRTPNAALDRIELECERLNELIGSLLHLSRLEAGTEMMDPEPFALDLLVREVALDADFEARSRNRSVDVTSADPCTATGKRELLRSAIENVIRNALRYTPDGTNVEVSLTHEHNSFAGEAVIRVRDHGIGVPPQFLADIFTPFYRVGDSRERSSGGAGLGLSIADRAIRLHGGQVKAENDPQGGLVVIARLPLTPQAIATPSQSTKSTTESQPVT